MQVDVRQLSSFFVDSCHENRITHSVDLLSWRWVYYPFQKGKIKTLCKSNNWFGINCVEKINKTSSLQLLLFHLYRELLVYNSFQKDGI